MYQSREAISDAGAGHIGKYSNCTYYQDGIGTFRPEVGTEPFIGEIDALTKVNEIRLETIVPKKKIDHVVKALLKAHPYEEVSYDVYKTERSINPIGFGLTGYTKKPIILEDLIKKVKQVLKLDHVQYVGNLNRYVNKIAICSGSGTDFMKEAYKQDVDVFITGDVKYHYATDALDHGLALVDGSHFGTEQIVIEIFKDLLNPLKELELIEDKFSENPIKTL